MALKVTGRLSGGLVLAFLLAGHHSALAHPMDGMDDTAFGKPAQARDAGRTVEIVMKDMGFEPSSITVRTGEIIRFHIVNTGSLDHDFTIGDARAQQAHRKEMAAMMTAGGAMHHGADGNAVSVKRGGDGELAWAFTKSGTFEYDCNIPGHYEAGMRGVITVVDGAKAE